MLLFWKRTGSRALPNQAFLEDLQTAAEGWEPIEKKKRDLRGQLGQVHPKSLDASV